MKSSQTTKPGSLALVETLRLIPGYDPFENPGDSWLDEEAAQRAIDFFPECLHHVEGDLAGQPFIIEPWEQAIVGNIFGWKRKDDKGRIVRRYREVFIYVARKNGKTPLVAGICVYVLFCDGEAGAQIYSAAADKDQAAIIFRHAKGMVEREPELLSRAIIFGGVGHRSMVLKDDQASCYKVLSADANTKHGGNSHFVAVDEVHAQPNRELIDVLKTSMASDNRKQPLMLYITTADFDRPSICNELHDYAGKVRDGVLENRQFLPVIYEAKLDDDWKAESTWRKANPNLGVSVSLGYMRTECQRAQDVPSYEFTFKRLHLNLKTQTDKKWLDLGDWDQCNGAVSEALLAGRKCYGGLDLSSTTDTTAFALAFPPLEGESIWSLLVRFWVPAQNAREKELHDRVPYQTWQRQGFLTLTDGNVVDYGAVRACIAADAKRFKIVQIAYDPWNATETVLELQQSGMAMFELRQGFFGLNEATKNLEKLVLSHDLAHGGNPILRWMASNTTVETDAAGNIKPSKSKSTGRIDGIAAIVNALSVARLRAGAAKPSVYETRGIRSL